MTKYSLGIDVSMKRLDVCLCFTHEHQGIKIKATTHFENHAKGFRALEHWIHSHQKEKHLPLSICMEATGVYYEGCALYLFKKGYALSVVLPGKAKHYMKASGLKTKTDRMDAKGLAWMGAEKVLSLWQPLSDYFYSLRALSRHVQSLQELKTSTANQLHALEHSGYEIKEVQRQLLQLLHTLEKQITETKKAMEEHIQSNEQVNEKITRICTLKGLGRATVATVLGETNGFALFTSSSQLVSYSGLDVVQCQSGQRKGITKISKKGNAHIRRALHFSALNVVRYEVTPFKDLYERTYQRHKIKMKSYVAVQKKLLVIIYTLYKKGEAFKETAFKKSSHEPTSVTTQGSLINSDQTPFIL